MPDFSIGQLARQAEVAIDTIRYYERCGLLRPAGRSASGSGYRRYGGAELKRLQFIRRAKALGFTLDEVAELLQLSGGHDRARIKQAAQARRDDLDRRIAELQRIRAGLDALIAACPGHGSGDCPILHALSEETPR